MNTEDTHETFYDMLDALRAYRKENGKAAETQLLLKVTGQSDLAKVSPSKFAEVIEATRSNHIKSGEQVTSSKRWKDIEKATKRGHAKVFTGLK